MDVDFLIRGLIIGFSIAMPVGPIGVLCIRRTLAEGRASGLVSGLGAATADAAYGAVAAFGLAFVTTFLVEQQMWLRLIGGLFLCYLGVSTFLSKPPDDSNAPVKRRSLASAYLSTLALTLTNPATILSFAAIFAAAGLVGAPSGYGPATMLVIGVFTGSALWWLILSTGVDLLRGRLGPASFKWVDRLSGVILFSFGLWALSGLF